MNFYKCLLSVDVKYECTKESDSGTGSTCNVEAGQRRALAPASGLHSLELVEGLNILTV